MFNTAPAAVPQFQKQGGLVALDSFPDGASYTSERVGARAEQYKSPDGKFYQLPWKTNPVQIFYNKKVFAKAGLDTDAPPLGTYQEFLATAKTVVDKGGVQAAIWPAPSSEFFQSWKEPYNGDAFADQKAAMSIVGPWAIAVYGDKVDWGVAPLPTSSGKDPAQIQTFSDTKSVGMYSSCQNRGTAWEFLKFATSQEQDGRLLEVTGQMPMREDLPGLYGDYFKANPAYTSFAEQAARTVEVPNVPNSVEIWQPSATPTPRP